MGQKLERIDYVAKEYSAIVQDIVQKLKETYSDHGNDFENEDNSGRMLVEVLAYVSDLLLYYLDRQANETYLPTARERQNIINICKLIGYSVAPATPAQAKIVFKLLQGPHDSVIKIPKGIQLTTPEKIVFELDQDVWIQPGMEQGTGSATEGESFSEQIAISNGEAGQAYYLKRTGVISAQALYVNNVRWEQAESLAIGNATSQIYTIEVDAFSRAKVIFGDGRNGAVPDNGAFIEVNYRVGGGIRGNVAAETITTMPNVARDSLGNRIQVAVSNPEPASGGANPEGIEHVKLWAPRSYETQGRAVTDSDYETIANTFFRQGVGRFAKSKAIMHERSGEANIVRIYVLTYGSDGNLVSPTEPLKASFISYIDDIKMLTDTVKVMDGTATPVKIEANVSCLAGFQEELVKGKVKNSLEKLLNPEERSMGQELRLSDLHRAIDEVEGVDWVEIQEPKETIKAGNFELLILGEVNLTAEKE